MNWLGKIVAEHVKPNDRILDLGCGMLQATDILGPRHFGVDVHLPYLDEHKESGMPVLHMDLQRERDRSMFVDKSWEVVLLLDVVEHLYMNDALLLLDLADRVARDTIIMLTPKGFVEQVGFDYEGKGHNEHQAHLCGFETTEFQKRGYDIKMYKNFSKQKTEGFQAILGIKRFV